MKRFQPCNSMEHGMSRRSMLAGLVGGAIGTFGISRFAHPLFAKELAAQKKQVLVVFLAGGVSQLETWDPKPNTEFGGPFLSIPTSVPGIHISELLPHTAKQMHHLSIVRSINTKENEHSKGRYFMETGRRDSPALQYPVLGAAAASLLEGEKTALPGFIHIRPGGSGFSKGDSAFLGPRYASVALGDGKMPENTSRPALISVDGDKIRNLLRQKADEQFLARRRTADTEAYTYSYDQAAELIARKDIFDVTKEPEKELERYGKHDFGRHCLLARRLLEHGIRCVKVTHSDYDSHSENFNFHLEQLGEFDRPFATLISDLADRGLLESTLVVVMSEFGRTPRINRNLGRDHWGTAWSVALGGCGIQPGAVVGKTNDNGTAVADREVDAAHLYHTYFRALGLDPTENYTFSGQSIPVADPAAKAIDELLA